MTWHEVLLNNVHPAVQLVAVGAIPVVSFPEHYVGAMVGTMAGLPVALTLGLAIVGNVLALRVPVELGSRLAARPATTRSEQQE